MTEEHETQQNEVVIEQQEQQEQIETTQDHYVEVGHKKLRVDSEEDKKIVIQYLNALKSESKKFKDAETRLSDLNKKVNALTVERDSMKASTDSLVSQAVEEAVGKYHSKLIDAELTSKLTAQEDFIGGEATKDAVKLLKADFKFTLAEDGTIKADEKPIEDVVKEFIAAKEVFKRAPAVKGFDTKGKSSINTRSQAEKNKSDLKTMLKGAIESSMNRISK